jgi:hypothetical protein
MKRIYTATLIATITTNFAMADASKQFDMATRHIEQQLEDYGLDEVEILRYPADGKTMLGTQKSRPVWDVRFAELWELESIDGESRRVRRLGDWESLPLTLAQDSLSADVTTTLVDVGAGTTEADYDGKDVRGKLVLTSSQPGAIVDLAVGEKGAAGIIWLSARRAQRGSCPTRPISVAPGGRKTTGSYAGAISAVFRRRNPSASWSRSAKRGNCNSALPAAKRYFFSMPKSTQATRKVNTSS